MSPDPLDLIKRVADVEFPVFTGDEVARWAPGMLTELTRLGLLHQGETASHVVCDACTEDHVGDVMRIRYPDGQDRFFIACSEHGRIEVERDRLFQWSVRFDPLCQFLATEFAIQGEPHEIIPSRLWEIGRTSLAGISRVVWVGRGLSWPDAETFSAVLPAGRSPVLLFLGCPPKAGLVGLPPDSIIELAQALSLSDGRIILNRSAIADQLSIAGEVVKVKPSRKRAPRVTAIDDLERALIRYITDYKEKFKSEMARGRSPEQIPRPTRQLLAAQLGLTPSRVSNAFKDPSAHTLRLLWEIAGDPDRVMDYRGL